MANHTHVNKWGYEGWNCKWRPAGSGTTHANRRELRQHLQWENLVQKEPGTAQKMEDHLEALEKATKKAQEKLEELKKKPLEKGKQDVEESCSSGSKRKHTKAKTSSSYSYESTTSTSSSQGAEKPPLKKADKPSLEKDGKPSLKKDDKPSLEKDGKPPVDKELRRTRVAKDGQPESLMQVKGGEEEPDWELVEQKRKGWKNKPLEKGTQEKNAMEEKKKPLEKGSGASTTKEKKGPLEKGTKIILKEAPPRPVVVVDWHNTLEKGDTVPVSHVNALKSLMEVANVHILSYVGSWAREQGVHLDIQSLIPSSLHHDLKGIHTPGTKQERMARLHGANG